MMCLFLNIPHARYFALSIANEKYKKGVKPSMIRKVDFFGHVRKWTVAVIL